MHRKPSPKRADRPGCKPADPAKPNKRGHTIANSDRSRKPAPLASLNKALDPAFWDALKWEIASSDKGQS